MLHDGELTDLGTLSAPQGPSAGAPTRGLLLMVLMAAAVFRSRADAFARQPRPDRAGAGPS